MAQPNMGDRKLYNTRPPEDVARAFERDIAGSGLSYSQRLADLVADRYDLPRPSERFRTKADLAAQASLPLGRSVRRRRRPARPREQYSTRLPRDVADAFESEVASLDDDVSYSSFLADLLAAQFGLQLPSERGRRAHPAHDQEVLPLGRAS
ncbi:MAG: hypothetical protein ABIP57_14995 [Jatrophihabitantaceae bacterium]